MRSSPRDPQFPSLVLRAPKRMGTRQAACDFLTDTPEDLQGLSVVVNCDGSWPTTSFIDELIVEVVMKRDAQRLTFAACDEPLAQLVQWVAYKREVSQRVFCEMAGN